MFYGKLMGVDHFLEISDKFESFRLYIFNIIYVKYNAFPVELMNIYVCEILQTYASQHNILTAQYVMPGESFVEPGHDMCRLVLGNNRDNWYLDIARQVLHIPLPQYSSR